MLLLRSTVLSFVLVPTLVAQAHEAIGSSFGVTATATAVHAGGPDYSVRFDAAGASFTPLLGKAVTRDPRLQFTFLDCARGEVVMAAQGAVAPTAEGEFVRYERDGIVEQYEARADGIEQSFVFAQRPAGDGDLVVRGRITTGLPLAMASADEVRFELPGLGGVAFGAVTGVDANGTHARGALRLCGDVLELSLSAAFVDTAAYPLVLDPLIGTAFVVGNDPAHDDVESAVAYDESNGRYLVVWAVHVPTAGSNPAHREIRGQFVTAGGGPQGSQLLFATDAYVESRPALANINSTDRFLVSWSSNLTPGSGSDLIVRSVSAATGAMSNPVVVMTTSIALGLDPRVAIGGDSRSGLFAGQDALLVYRTTTILTNPGHSINARLVQVPATGDPVLRPNVPVANSANLLADVAVSPHCGSAGRWIVGFGQSVQFASSQLTRIIAQVVDDTGVLCGTPVTIVNSGSGADLRSPAIATRDGNEFVVAWHDAVASTVKLRRGVVSGACGSTSWVFDPILSPIVQAGAAQSPAIVFAKDKYVLAWQQQGTTGQRVYTKGLDPGSCASCGREERVDATLVTDAQPALASRWDGGETTSDQAMVAYATNGAIFARHWQTHGTAGITTLGGGCGIPGFSDFASYHGQPVLGDSTFGVDLVSPTSPVLLLVVGFTPANLPCGACTLVPSMDVLLPGVSPTAIPIPCDPNLMGSELYTQWIQYRPSGCPALPDLGLSNCLKFTIAE